MPQRAKPPTRTRAEYILELKEKMQHHTKTEVFNTLIEFFTTVDLAGIADQLPPAPAHRTPLAGDRTSAEAHMGGATGGRAPYPDELAYRVENEDG